MIGENEAIELAVIAIIAKGHALLEDVPRTGTTSLAKSVPFYILLDGYKCMRIYLLLQLCANSRKNKPPIP